MQLGFLSLLLTLFFLFTYTRYYLPFYIRTLFNFYFYFYTVQNFILLYYPCFIPIYTYILGFN